jgi:hypothetical protein
VVPSAISFAYGRVLLGIAIRTTTGIVTTTTHSLRLAFISYAVPSANSVVREVIVAAIRTTTGTNHGIIVFFHPQDHDHFKVIKLDR